MAKKKNSPQTVQPRKYSWMVRYWRPAMAWQYFTVCLFDFLFAPFLWAVYHALLDLPVTQWDPISLRTGGLYHLSMGAIVGVSAWTRTLEKIEMMKKLSTDLVSNDPDYITEEQVVSKTKNDTPTEA